MGDEEWKVNFRRHYIIAKKLAEKLWVIIVHECLEEREFGINELRIYWNKYVLCRILHLEFATTRQS